MCKGRDGVEDKGEKFPTGPNFTAFPPLTNNHVSGNGGGSRQLKTEEVRRLVIPRLKITSKISQ